MGRYYQIRKFGPRPPKMAKIKFSNLFIFHIKIHFQRAAMHLSTLILLRVIPYRAILSRRHILGHHDQIWKFGPRPPKKAKLKIFKFIHIPYLNTLPTSYYAFIYLRFIKSFSLVTHFINVIA